MRMRLMKNQNHLQSQLPQLMTINLRIMNLRIMNLRIMKLRIKKQMVM